jgi:RNA polymerase sigma-70 factor (ECF subfamily)
MAASREGDFEGLDAVLHPDVVLRADLALGVSREVRGAEAVAGQARMYRERDRFSRLALVNGAAGMVVASDEQTYAVLGFTVAGGKIVAIDILADPERLERLDLP